MERYGHRGPGWSEVRPRSLSEPTSVENYIVYILKNSYVYLLYMLYEPLNENSGSLID